MRQAETCTELDELNGTMTTLYPACGDFTHPVEFHMDLIGTIGALSRKLLGKKITDSG